MTTDFRDVFSEIVATHMGASRDVAVTSLPGLHAGISAGRDSRLIAPGPPRVAPVLGGTRLRAWHRCSAEPAQCWAGRGAAGAIASRTRLRRADIIRSWQPASRT